MPEDPLDREEVSGLTADQAIRLLELRGVRFHVMDTQQFDDLLSSTLP
jgi:hypothetical protein